jgi:hypothetical protein
MPRRFKELLPSGSRGMSTVEWQVIGLAAFAGLVLAGGIWVLFLHKDPPDKRERRRRLAVNSRGRLSDGMVTDVGSDVVYYSYSVRGVEYRASQETSTLTEFLPDDLDRMIGPVTLKYSPRNPANSIVLCEHWSGLRIINKETVST